MTTQLLTDGPVLFATKIFSRFDYVLFIKHKDENNRFILKMDSLICEARSNTIVTSTPLFFFMTVPGVEVYILKADMKFKYNSKAEFKSS